MSNVTSAEFQRNFGQYKREALASPVSISIHKRPTLVLMSYDHYQQLVSGQPTVTKVTTQRVVQLQDPDAEMRALQQSAGEESKFRFDDLME